MDLLGYGFHPTLVLAQRAFARLVFCSYPVSIPHWFSLNERAIENECDFIGFHPTLVLAQLN